MEKAPISWREYSTVPGGPEISLDGQFPVYDKPTVRKPPIIVNGAVDGNNRPIKGHYDIPSVESFFEHDVRRRRIVLFADGGLDFSSPPSVSADMLINTEGEILRYNIALNPMITDEIVDDFCDEWGLSKKGTKKLLAESHPFLKVDEEGMNFCVKGDRIAHLPIKSPGAVSVEEKLSEEGFDIVDGEENRDKVWFVAPVSIPDREDGGLDRTLFLGVGFKYDNTLELSDEIERRLMSEDSLYEIRELVDVAVMAHSYSMD